MWDSIKDFCSAIFLAIALAFKVMVVVVAVLAGLLIAFAYPIAIFICVVGGAYLIVQLIFF